jgi:hypothetical protein
MTSESTRMVSTNRIRLATLGALLIIFFLGMGLRLYQLDADSLWLDEIVTARKAQLGLLSIPQTVAQTDTFPPLLYMLTHLFIRFSGDSEFVIRLPAALLGSASILLIYGVGSMLWTRMEGLAAAFLLAVNPWHIRYSQEARWYALMVFLSLLSLIFLLKALKGNSRGSWLAFALVTALALYNHYFAFLILPAEILFAAWVIWNNWTSTRRGPTGSADEDHVFPRPPGELATDDPSDPPMDVRMRHPSNVPNPRTQASYLIGSLLVVALCYVPWLPMMHQQLFGPIIQFEGVGAGTHGIESSVQLYEDMLRAHSGMDSAFWPAAWPADRVRTYSGVEGAALLLLLILLLLGLARCKPRYLLLFGLWFVMPFLFISLANTARWLHPRYGIHTLPINLLLVATGIGTIGHFVERYGPSTMAPRVRSLVAMTPLVILVGLLQVPSLRAYYFEQKEDWRDAAQYLADHLQPGDAILAEGTEFRTVGDDNRVVACLPYYLGVYGSEDVQLLRVRRDLWRGLRNLEGWNGRLWGVVYHESELADAETAQVVDFHQVAIVRLREPSGSALQDTASLLNVLLDAIPQAEAHFDMHLALADIYIRSAQLEQAAGQLQMASAVKPDAQAAFDSLDAKLTHLQKVSARLEDIPHPLWRLLGEELYFLGYEASPGGLQAGDTLELTLWWRAARDMDRDYTCFIHVVDQENHIWAQEDALLQRGERPTSTWNAGDIVRQQYQVVLPADMPSGEYSVVVGAYYWRTGERLPVWDESGQRLADDVIVLQLEMNEQEASSPP